MEFYRSAFKHGLDRNTILHGLEHALTVIELEPAADPPRVLAIGGDRAGICWRSSGSNSTAAPRW